MSTFKKTKVVMLSTNKPSKIGNLATYQKRSLAKVIKEGINPIGSTVQFWNLYIISDDEIKENGTHFYNPHSGQLHISGNHTDYKAVNNNGCKKIIATTDVSLGLPQPSKQFIQKFVEEYNKGNIITDVLVEYETLYDIELLVDTQDFRKGSYIRGRCSSKEDFSKAKKRFFELHTDGNHYSIARDTNKVNILYKTYFKDVEFTDVKINPKDNTITIKKVKDSWNREEILNDIEQAIIQGLDIGQYRDKWIKKTYKV